MRDPDDFNALRILIAGGRPHAVQLLRQLFDMLGVRRVHTAGQLQPAVDLLRTHRFSAVFVDEHIGDDTPEAFVYAARRAPGLVDVLVPIFLVYGGPKRRDIEAARDLGFTDVLTRPLSALTLDRKIRAALASPRPFIAAESFFGPDRRTRPRDWQGDERRKRQPRKIKIAAPVEPNSAPD